MMAKANVNPKTGLATDYLNLFNEYIMLAEMVNDGLMEENELKNWKESDYESHFIKTGFRGVDIVLSAYYHMDKNVKSQFIDEVNKLISLIKNHQKYPLSKLSEIKHQRDLVEAIIAKGTPIGEDEHSHAQEDIDALFD